MSKIVPFDLEDFFLIYEHRPQLINLASSDAQPWTWDEVANVLGWSAADFRDFDFHYPDVRGVLERVIDTVRFRPDGMQVLPTSGAAEAILISLLETSSKIAKPVTIAIPQPCYGAYEGLAELLGFTPIYYGFHTRSDWSLDVDTLLKAVSTCSVVVITNPTNPTGHWLHSDTFDHISSLIRQRHGLIIVDEVFRLHDQPSLPSQYEPHVITICSLSKVYGFPGLRLGWLVASPDRIARMRTLQQYGTLSLPSFSVWLGAQIMERLDLFGRGALLSENRAIVVEWAMRHANVVQLVAPHAGTTAVLVIRNNHSVDQIFDALLAHDVLLVPGSRFSGIYDAPWFRLGYGIDSIRLQEGLDRVSASLSSLEHRN